ncbi:MAG: dTMP kinase [bacterium]
MKTNGRFIVIEGIDGAGTTTQAALLCGKLRDRGMECELTREPSGGPIGRLIRDFLEKRITPLRDVYGDEFAERDALSLLFTADRMDHLYREVIPRLRAGAHVVSDRYLHSTCAYQMKDEGHLDWILSLHKYAPAPDLTIYIDLQPQDALARIRMRSDPAGETAQPDGPELFETSEQLTRIHAAYEAVNRRLAARGDCIATIDGRPSAADVHSAIMLEVESLLSK